MSTFTIPNVFVANTIIQSAAMNANFTAISNVFNNNLLPVIGTANALVTTDSSGNLAASTISSKLNLTTKGDLLTYNTLPTRLAVGTDGQTLIADSTQALGIKWATPASTADPKEVLNLGLSVTAASSVLTIALKQFDGSTDPTSGNPVVIGMRPITANLGGWSARPITSALSQTISLQTTLGMLASQSNNLWIYAVDSDGAGTMKLGASTVRYEDGSLNSTVKESGAATITIASPGVVTETAHGRVNNDVVQFTTTGSLPTGLSVATNYYVLSATTNTYQLAAFPGGTAINTSGTQSGTHTVHTAGTNIVSSGAYTGVPTRLIGRAKFNLVTSGTWIGPTFVSLIGQFEDKEAISALYTLPSNTGVFTPNPWPVQINTDTHGIGVYSSVLPQTKFIIPKSGVYAIRFGGGSSAEALVSAAGMSGPFTSGLIGHVSTDTLDYQNGSIYAICNRNDLVYVSTSINCTITSGARVNIEYIGPSA